MKKLWFRRRTYGWGWTPATIEGWLTVLIYILGLVLFFHSADLTSNASSLTYTILFVIWTAIFIAVSIMKGEKPRWQWGRKDDDNV